jgi:hypothetical protein
MAYTPAQKKRVAELYYVDCKGRRGMTDIDIAVELMTLILTNPSAAQKVQITNFLAARKADSQAIEAAAPGVATTTVATQDALQAELDTLTGDL